MKGKSLTLLPTLLMLLLLSAAATIVAAQSSAQFDLAWHVVGNGGRASTSANYRVNGTLGQSLASPATLTGATFRVTSGYWAAPTLSIVYLPLVIRQ